MKQCSQCKKQLDEIWFHTNLKFKDGLSCHCKFCNIKYTKPSTLKKDFGMGLTEYEDLLIEQLGVCAICKKRETGKSKIGRRKALAVDHNHETGAVRGLLCSRCNRGLGFFKDNPAYLQAAYEYLLKHDLPNPEE